MDISMEISIRIKKTRKRERALKRENFVGENESGAKKKKKKKKIKKRNGARSAFVVFATPASSC